MWIGRKSCKTDDVKTHVRKQLYENQAVALTSTEVDLPVKGFPISICCHSESPGCVEIVMATRDVADLFNKEKGVYGTISRTILI